MRVLDPLATSRNDVRVEKRGDIWVTSCADCWVFGGFASHNLALHAANWHLRQQHAEPSS